MVTRQAATTARKGDTIAASIAVAVGLIGFGLKGTGWILTGSEAIFSDALESTVNIVASIVALAAIIYARRPADAEHPYGHGKAEFASAALEGVMIAFAGVVVLVHSLEGMARARPAIERLDLGLWLLFASGVLNGVTGGGLLWWGKRNDSAALVGDGRHLLADLLTTLGVIGALLLVQATGMLWIDTAAAVLLATILVIVGGRQIRESLSSLLERQDAGDHAKICAALERHVRSEPATICSFDSLRHRHDGRAHWIDMHLRVPAKLTVAQGHAIATVIEREVLDAVGEGTATAHIEPCDGRCGRASCRC